MSTNNKKRDEVSGTQTTGHEWDGIQELDTPMPRWWLGIFFACIVWAIGYWILMPAWPMLQGYTPGLLGYSQRATVAADLRMLEIARAGKERELTTATVEQIQANPDQLQFAMAQGKSAFGDNCAPCHGAGGQGAHGYPNLNDDAWLWGGTVEDIQHTITVGIRSTDRKTRNSLMPAFGRDGILMPQQIDDLTQYVVQLSGRTADNAAIARAMPMFAENCAACHGAEGKGNRKLGGPDLTDSDWLYGPRAEDIKDQILTGHGGVMPAWGGRLSPETIKSLAVYVHNLGGGE